MSLRRRPAETATYIPRSQHGNNGGNGFALTSSGALGFSDDIENQLSYTTSCNASSRAETMKTSANPGEGGKKAISCNRDAVASIRPFSSMTRTMMNPMHEEQQQHSDEDEEEEMHTAFGLGMDEEDEMMHMGAPVDAAERARKIVMKAHLPKGMGKKMSTKEELQIEDAYVEYVSSGDYHNVHEMVEAVKSGSYSLRNVPHRVFRTVEKFHKPDYQANFHHMKETDKMRLNDLRDAIKSFWKRAHGMSRTKFVAMGGDEVIHRKNWNDDPKVEEAYYYKKCMDTYTEASNLVRSFERQLNLLHQPSVPRIKKTDEVKTPTPSPSQFNSAPSRYSPAKMYPARDTRSTHGSESIGDSSSSLSSIRAMLQQKTRDLQMKLGANMRSDHEEHEFCTCAEPQPVPINHESMYCTCKEPEPVQLGESMYCTCKNPVPVLSTGDRMPRSDKGTKETKYLGGDEYFEEQHDHQSKKQGKKKAGEHNRTETTTFPHGTRTAKVNAGHSVEHNRARHTNGNGHNDARGYGGMRSGQPMSVKDILAMRGF